MATYDKGKVITLPAGANLTGKMYHVIALNSDGEAILATASTNGIGILFEEATEGNACAVLINGTCAVVAGAAFSAGAPLTADANGAIVAADAAADPIVGVALETAGAGGVIVEALISPVIKYIGA